MSVLREICKKPSCYLIVSGMIFVLVSAILNSKAELESGNKLSIKKIVFVAGKPSHPPGEHEHRAGCMLLADQLKKSGLPVNVEVVSGGYPTDAKILDDADAVIFYSDGNNGHAAYGHFNEVKKLAEKGVGIGCLHYAVEMPKGGDSDILRDTIGGCFEVDFSVNPHWDANFKMPNHEVANGIQDYGIRDEWYYNMRFRKDKKDVTSILEALPPASSIGADGPRSGNHYAREAVAKGEKQTTMWVFDRKSLKGGGRGFGFTGGHFHKNWQNDNQRRIVLNAIAWIAGIPVPKDGVKTITPTDEEMKANLDHKK